MSYYDEPISEMSDTRLENELEKHDKKIEELSEKKERAQELKEKLEKLRSLWDDLDEYDDLLTEREHNDLQTIRRFLTFTIRPKKQRDPHMIQRGINTYEKRLQKLHDEWRYRDMSEDEKEQHKSDCDKPELACPICDHAINERDK